MTTAIWVDDLCPPYEKMLLYPVDLPDLEWIWVKSSQEFWALYRPNIEVLALDNDLGLESAEEGQHILRKLLFVDGTDTRHEWAKNLKEVYLITNNAVARNNMRGMLTAAGLS